MKIIIKAIFTIIVIFTPHISHAGISVGKVVIEFAKDKRNYLDVPIFNTSKDEKAYVEVTVREVINPGTKEEKRIEVLKSKENRLIVSPQKLVIPPSAKKNLRFISLHKNLEKDKIYRVKVVPVIGGIESEAKYSIKLLVGYEILVIIRPDKINEALKVVREGKKISFSNEGNTNILIRKGIQCAANDKSNCQDLPGKRLYAGNSIIRNLPYDTEVEYTIDTGDKIIQKKY